MTTQSKVLTKQLSFLTGLLVTVNAIAVDDSALEPNKILLLHPTQCVALNQGNLCYVDIEITWSVKTRGNYCLFSSQQNDAILCWESAKSGKFEGELIANEDVIFHLKIKESNTILDTAKLEMAWVYKKNNRTHSRWRMF